MAGLTEKSSLPRIVSDDERLQSEIELIERIQNSPSIAGMLLATVVVVCQVCESEHFHTDVDPLRRGDLQVHGALIGVREFRRHSSGAIVTTCPNKHEIEPPLTDTTWWMLEKHLGQVEEAWARHQAVLGSDAETITLVSAQGVSLDAA